MDNGRYNKNISIYRTLNTRPPRTNGLQKQVYRSMIAYSSATMNDRSGKTSMTVLGTVLTDKIAECLKIVKKKLIETFQSQNFQRRSKIEANDNTRHNIWTSKTWAVGDSLVIKKMINRLTNRCKNVVAVPVPNSSLLVVNNFIIFYINKRNLPKKVPKKLVLSRFVTCRLRFYDQLILSSRRSRRSFYGFIVHTHFQYIRLSKISREF